MGSLRGPQRFILALPLVRSTSAKADVALGIVALLVLYGLSLHVPFDRIGHPHALRLLCFAFVWPPSFFGGFPMPVAMATLPTDTMLFSAWGIDGCLSVIGIG